MLVLGGARAFDPCNVIFWCQGHEIDCLILFKEQKKKSLTQDFWTERNGEIERDNKIYREHECVQLS